jgi:hypothetical protein
VCAPAVIIIKIARKRFLEVSFIQHDDVIQTLPADGADDSLRVRVLPWTPGSDQHFFYTQALHPLLEVVPIGLVPISNEILGCRVVWKGLHDLLRGPLSRQILGYIKMDESAPMMREHDKDEEHLESHRRYDEEIDGYQVLTWFFKNAFQVGEGGLVGRMRYLSTVDWATSIPSLPSSPTIRGEPHPGLALEILRIRSRTSMGTFGLPGLLLWLSLRQ